VSAAGGAHKAHNAKVGRCAADGKGRWARLSRPYVMTAAAGVPAWPFKTSLNAVCWHRRPCHRLAARYPDCWTFSCGGLAGWLDHCSERIASSSASGSRTTGPRVRTQARRIVPRNGNGAV
jgi:hypothetical protein